MVCSNTEAVSAITIVGYENDWVRGACRAAHLIAGFKGVEKVEDLGLIWRGRVAVKDNDGCIHTDLDARDEYRYVVQAVVQGGYLEVTRKSGAKREVVEGSVREFDRLMTLAQDAWSSMGGGSDPVKVPIIEYPRLQNV